MFNWFKRIWIEREEALAKKDAQVRTYHSEALLQLAEREKILAVARKDFDAFALHVQWRSDSLKDVQSNLIAYKQHLDERTALLDKMRRDIDQEKESMLGKDNLEVKRAILLPMMKQKWEAEAKLLDSQRGETLAKVPKFYLSLESRKLELENQIRTVKTKPATMGNQTLLIQWEAKLQEVAELIELIDKERARNAEIPAAGSSIS